MSQEQVLQIKGVRLWTAIPELGHYPLVDTNRDKVVSKPKRFIPFEFSGSL